MSRHVITMQTAVISAVVCIILSGCGGESYTYEPDHELKPGPGLFSGKDGVFTIVGPASKKEASQKKKKTIQ